MATPEIARARRLRRDMTYAEAMLWRMLRHREFENLKFRRQAPVGPYVVDFLCKLRRLVIELDGGIHDAPFYDRARQGTRDDWLKGQGYTVLRFRNSDVEHRPELIRHGIRKTAPQVSFSPRGEGVGGADG